jgi:catechol 2,3-dioxygenase-like lactoylglutathione lyase family enzyme
MNLNHINLTVTDVQETYRFLETYFGMKGQGGNNNIAFLTDQNGMILTLTSMKLGKESEVHVNRLAFGQDDEARLVDMSSSPSATRSWAKVCSPSPITARS